ncbi:MAG: aryl-sulfate sulfotransferase [Bryobacteraceae bacterium]
MLGAVSILFAVSFDVARSAPAVRILPALPSPQAVGTVVGLTAIPKEEGDPLKVFDKLRFRYSVSVDGGDFHIIRDFDRNPSFAWRPELYEHQAHIKVVVENTETEQTGEADLPFQVVSRVRGEQSTVTPTAHPLVALFSSAACPEGSQFRVAFKRGGDAEDSRTGLEPCRGSRSSNIYVAGMRADSTYVMHSEIVAGLQARPGPTLAFHTGIADGKLGPLKVTDPGHQKTISREPLLIFSMEEPVTRPITTDLDGNLVWYLPEAESSLTRMLSGGRFLVFRAGGNDENSRLQVLSEVDLAGNILRETNITRVAEQFRAHGIGSVCRPNGQQCIPGFHHDAIRLPNGHTLAIASLERMFPGGSQGSKDPTDVLGVLLVDLDADLQLQWYWNAFDHLDVKRAAFGDGKCKGTTGGGGCPPVFLAPSANDWLHGNAIAYSRADGNLLLSLPEQDWVIKIDYQDGKGTGKVLWRLGDQGDFSAGSSNPSPWFSYQHDSAFEPSGSDTLVLLDNGQRRKKKDPQARTRGQMWKIDEKTRRATLLINADLGVYSPWVGSAQRLSNGNFHFMTGAVLDDTSFSGRSFETSPEGKLLRVLEMSGTLIYRSNRIVDLYTPPNR